VVAAIILAARDLRAADAFRDRYLLDALRQQTAAAMAGVDALLLPTVPHVPTVDEVLADPIGTNIALGRFTTFVNLLGLCAVSVPGAPRRDGVPSGVSVVARGGDDHRALDIASIVEGDAVQPSDGGNDRVALAVVGAHLEGQPLHHELTSRDARLVSRTATAAAYRLYALSTTPPKPGLVRADRSGVAIEVEVWSLEAAAFASFVADVPPPLAIGKVELADGAWVPGFVCEPRALDGASDITQFRSWRSFRAAAR
jgi:allophanate hydrolase